MWNTRALVALAFVGVASTVQAQSLKVPSTVFAAAAAADWTTTYYNVTHPTAREWSHEQNPLINWAESTPAVMVALGASIDAGCVYFFNRWADHTGHRRLARVMLYSAAGVRVGLAIRNVQRRPRPQQ